MGGGERGGGGRGTGGGQIVGGHKSGETGTSRTGQSQDGGGRGGKSSCLSHSGGGEPKVLGVRGTEPHRGQGTLGGRRGGNNVVS